MYLVKSILFLFIVNNCQSYRILGIFPFNGKSHQVIFDSLMKGLADKNHQIDLITQFPLKNPPSNIKTIVDLTGTIETLPDEIQFYIRPKFSLYDITDQIALVFGNDLCQLMGLKEVQDFIQNIPNVNPPYDLVITEAFGANCFMGFGHLLKVPVIAVSSSIEFPWFNNFIGNADNPAFVPNSYITYFDKNFNFLIRLKNFLSSFYHINKFNYLTGYNQTMAMKKYLSPDVPDIRTVEKNVALTLVNSHHVLFGVKPLTPGLVPIAGIHIENNAKNLPYELQYWMDDSVEGVVYFSFGTVVAIETLDKNVILDLYKSFSKISPVKVLMKINNETRLPQGLPNNVKILSWIPQFAVLGHQNTKVFITHGGLFGIIEALHYGVPTISIPIFSDQPRNVAALLAKNLTVKIDFNNITESSMDEALNKILKNPEYREINQYYSKIFRERPMGIMETAIYWIEYVIRNGSDSLKSPALELNWWELAMIDIYLFLAVFVSFNCYIFYAFTKYFFKVFKKLCLKKNKLD